MIYLSTLCNYDENNDFHVQEVYVSDNTNGTYILKKNSGYVPILYNISLKDLYDMSKNSLFPLFGFGQIRVYNDNDPKTFANFLFNKISKVDMSSSVAEKKLFDVLNNFGTLQDEMK